MFHHITVLGGDLRQKYLAARLMGGGFEVETYRVPELPDSSRGLCAALQHADAVALPMPTLTKDGWIQASPQPIPLISVLECLSADTILFGGPFRSAEKIFASYPFRLSDYTLSPVLAAGNAVPTAEGAIQLAMEHLPITLSGSRCLVVGFGRIGKVIAARLAGLCAHVTVAARKAEDRALAEALGFSADQTGMYLRGLARYDCVFNTVPAPVFTSEHLSLLRPDCLLLDLASAPGGLSPEVGAFQTPTYLTAPGLPGKVAPSTATDLLYAHILSTFSAFSRG